MDASTGFVTVPSFSAVPGLVHGFETRGERSSVETREETRRRVASALAHLGSLHLLHQVHGSLVREAPWVGSPEADAAVARDRGILLGIETADCLPILYVDPERRAVAAAHAGWRGSAAGIAVSTLEALRRSGSRPEEILVALGPCIGPCCYVVGDEVLSAFGALAPVVSRTEGGCRRLDLRKANEARLVAAGVRRESLHHVPQCTFCSAGGYHSYRRDGPGAGRMISFVGFEKESERA